MFSLKADLFSTCSEPFSLTVKSLKPALSFTVQIAPSDSIQQLKANVASSSSTAPRAEFQRLLLKGKALADAKLVKEYGIAEGATVNMVLKPGWDDVPKTGSELGGDPTPTGATIPKEPVPQPGAIPSLTISDADPAAEGTTSTSAFPARPLTTLDISSPANQPGPSNSTAEFHNTIADPEFWKKVYALCQSEFLSDHEADGCWHAFLGGVRTKLSPGEIAKIQDAVGVTGEYHHGCVRCAVQTQRLTRL
jgi:hypothetical protein